MFSKLIAYLMASILSLVSVISSCMSFIQLLLFGKNKSITAFGFAIAASLVFVFTGVDLAAAAIAAPDMTDATGSVTNVFGAILGVAVLIFGFKKVKGLL